MTQNLAANEKEQGAYRYCAHDGLWDILIGLSVLFAGLYMLLDISSAFIAIWVVLWLPAWRSAKKSITEPRMQYLQVSKEQHAGLIRAGVLSAGALLVVVVAVVAVLLAQATGRIPAWFLAWLEEYLIVVLGLLGSLVLVVAGWLSGVHRLYAYAVLTLIVLGVGYLLNTPAALAAALLGAIITLWGAVMLLRFVRRYPKEAT